MEGGAAHAIGPPDHAHPAPVAFVHRRGEARQARRRPRIVDQHGPRRIRRREADIDDDDLAAPFARDQVAAPRPAERDGETRMDGTVCFTAREIEPRRSVDGEDGRPVGGQPLRERQHVSFGRTCRTRAQQRIHGDGGLRPAFFAPQLAHAVESREGAIVDRVVGFGSTAATHTGIPAAWSARAITQPSPPYSRRRRRPARRRSLPPAAR